MNKLRQIFDFVLYVIAAWRKTFSGKPKAGEGSQTSVEEMDNEAWKKAQERYVESMRKSEDNFWRGEK